LEKGIVHGADRIHHAGTGHHGPDFALPDVVSGRLSPATIFPDRKALLIVFICAHCPYVKHIEKSFPRWPWITRASLWASCISTTMPLPTPKTALPDSSGRPRSDGFSFPYLYDQSQAAAHAYKAACSRISFSSTADLRLIYRGQFDSSRPGNGIPVTGEDLPPRSMPCSTASSRSPINVPPSAAYEVEGVSEPPSIT